MILFDNFTLVDLTHPLSATIPTWDNSCGFQLNIGADKDEMVINTSAGTHIDAPSHFFDNKCTIDILPLKQLLAPVCVIDVSTKAHGDYALSLQDIHAYETAFGKIPKNCMVVGYTGWSRFWTDSKAYRNCDENGNMHYPVFSMEAIECLLERGIAGIAIDSFSPELIRVSQTSFPIHERLLNAEKYIIENLANGHLLSPKGTYMIALPLKVQKGGEAPARVIGLIPKEDSFIKPSQ